jgi:hypothetical protein
MRTQKATSTPSHNLTLGKTVPVSEAVMQIRTRRTYDSL